MKKHLLTLSLLAGALTASAAVGDTFQSAGLEYTQTGENTVSVTDCITGQYSVTLDIPSTVTYNGSTMTVTAIGRDAFYWSNLVSVNIPATVQTIEFGAFRSCSSLAAITFAPGSQLQTIADYAFNSAPIATITIPEGVTSIGASCFFTCKNLASISLPSTLTSIGASAFYKAALTSITLPEGLTQLGKSAFLFCEKMTSVTLPSTLTELTDGLFQGCKLLTSVTLPTGVTSIGEECFLESGITGTFNLPASLQTIGSGAFAGTKITSFNLASGNTAFTKVGEAIYSADKRLLYTYPPMSTATTVNVANGCVGIAGGAFWKSNVTSVTLPSTMRALDDYAFCQAESLSSINFPASLVYLGEQAFAGTALTQVNLPWGITQLPEAVFAQCTSLVSVSLPSSMEYIDIRNFWQCTSLQTLNCYGATAPLLETWYEEYESPFYNVPSSCKLHVPAGCKSAYTTGDWNYAFGSTRTLEDLPGYFTPVSITPADNTTLSSLESIVFNFDTAATIVTSSPAIRLVEGPLAAGVPVGASISVDEWIAVKEGANGVKIFPADYDGFTAPVRLNQGTEYYLTIPAGIMKDASGNLNDAMMMHFTGDYVQPTFAPTSFSPANDAIISSFDGVTLNFAAAATANSSLLSSVRFLKGSIGEDGEVTGTDATGYDFEEWRVTSSQLSPRIWPADMDYYTVNISLQDDTDYYMIIPARMFRNSDWVYTDQIILHYSNGVNTGIRVTDESDSAIVITSQNGDITVYAAEADVQVYNMAGVMVASTSTIDGVAHICELAAGIYVVRASRNGVTRSAKVKL